MKKLLLKELRLALHPTNMVFLALSAMLIIPAYPYYVVFFYTTLGLFFVCLTGRENKDIDYTLTLPVRRCDLVRARVLLAVVIQLAQMVSAIPFAILSQHINRFGNVVGMDANVAFFGFALVMLGLFNLVFFPVYYQKPERVGLPFILASAVQAVYIVLMELAAHQVPFVRRYLDTLDPAYMPWKLAVLGVGALLFGLMTFAGCRMAEKRFEQVDL